MVERFKSMPAARRMIVVALLVGVALFVALGGLSLWRGLVFGWVGSFGAALAFLSVVALALRTPSSEPLLSGLGGLLGEKTPENPEQKREVAKFEEHLRHTRDFMRAKRLGLYDLPWYLLIGTPSCGKTKLVKRAGLPWVARDIEQGDGGTEFFDLWPSEHAVMVDTAGRMVQDGGPVWTTFLERLKRARPRCPINGVILAVSTEELVDSPEEKVPQLGARMQQKLAETQAALGVRFPVYVVVTKSDKIPGFAGLCQRIEDSDSQHQIVGWAEARPLVEEPTFPVGETRALLAPLFETLRRRRAGFLLNPGEGDGRRIDKVDRVYELPAVIEGKFARRLQRYLEAVFTLNQSGAGGEKDRPLFVRGIFFTTSVQEGRELDEELAKALGVKLSELPPAPGAPDSRPYFISDLLRKKVFVEKGLVTGSSNVGKYVFWRRGAMLASAALLVVCVSVGAWSAYGSLQRAIGERARLWHEEATLKGIKSSRRAVVASGDPKSPPTWSADRAATLKRLAELAREPVDLRWPYSWLPATPERGYEQMPALVDECLVGPALETFRDPAYHAALFRQVALRGSPVSSPAHAEAVKLLAELMRLEALASGATSASQPSPFQIDRVVASMVSERKSDAKDLADSLKDWLAPPPKDGARFSAWQFGKKGKNREVIESLVSMFLAKWGEQIEQRTDDDLAAVDALERGLRDFADAERKLADLAPPTTVSQYGDFAREWKSQVARIQNARERIDQQLKVVNGIVQQDLTRVRDVIGQRVKTRYAEDCQILLAALGPPPKPADGKPGEDEWIAGKRQRLEGAQVEWATMLQGYLEKVATSMRSEPLLAAVGAGQAYAVRAGRYVEANNALDAAVSDGETAVATPAEVTAQTIKDLLPQADRVAKDPWERTVAVAKFAAARRKMGAAIDKYLPKSEDDLTRLVEARAGWMKLDKLVLQSVLFTDGAEQEAAPARRPEAAQGVLSACWACVTQIRAKEPSLGDAPSLPIFDRSAGTDPTLPIQQFVQSFLSYWSEQCDLPIKPPADWGRLRAGFTRSACSAAKAAVAARLDRAESAVAAVATALGVSGPDASPSPGEQWLATIAKKREQARERREGFASDPAANAREVWLKLAEQPDAYTALRALSDADATSMSAMPQSAFYWSALLAHAPGLLADHVRASAAKDLADAKALAGAFPVRWNGEAFIDPANTDHWSSLSCAKSLKTACDKLGGGNLVAPLVGLVKDLKADDLDRAERLRTYFQRAPQLQALIVTDEPTLERLAALPALAGWKRPDAAFSHAKFIAPSVEMDTYYNGKPKVIEVPASSPAEAVVGVDRTAAGKPQEFPARLPSPAGPYAVFRWVAQARKEQRAIIDSGEVLIALPTADGRAWIGLRLASQGFDFKAWMGD